MAHHLTCASCVFFNTLDSGPEKGRGFCRGGPISQMPIKEANEFGSTHARPIYSAGEPACVMHKVVLEPDPESAVDQLEACLVRAETAEKEIERQRERFSMVRDVAEAMSRERRCTDEEFDIIRRALGDLPPVNDGKG